MNANQIIVLSSSFFTQIDFWGAKDFPTQFVKYKIIDAINIDNIPGNKDIFLDKAVAPWFNKLFKGISILPKNRNVLLWANQVANNILPKIAYCI